MFDGSGVSVSPDDKRCGGCIVVTAAHQCEYPSCYLTVCLNMVKMVDFILCVFYTPQLF